MNLLIIFSVVITLIWCITKEEINRQLANDYEVDPNGRFRNAELLTVHLIPHTHNDIGWLKTIDEYYVKEVRYILTTVVQALQENPERKFTYIEQKFFQIWWNEQSEKTREVVRKLVANGQLELSLGGWCMPDEAGPEYESMIYNMAIGTRFIKEQFGTRPTVAWHIDPFGHTKQNARLLADMGFNAFAINRIDYRLKDKFKNTQEMEFIWKTSDSLGNETSLFVHTLSNHYSAPGEFDVMWPNYATNDKWPNFGNNSELESYPDNIEKYCDNIVNMLRTREKYYNNGGHLLITMGDDFTYPDAVRIFENIDGVMKYINDHRDKYNVKMQYSHFSDYVEAVHQTGKKWKVYTDDLVPYLSSDDSAWTGYYTSRPRSKGEIRDALNYLKSMDFLDTNTVMDHNKVDTDHFNTILKLRKGVSQLQHHDAITGTEKQYVADDYLDILAKDLSENKKLMENIIVEFTKNSYKFSMNFTSVIQALSPNNDITMVVVNNLGWKREEVICLISPTSEVNITSSDGRPLPHQITPIPGFSLDIRNGSYYIYFAVQVQPLGHNTIIISHSTQATVTPQSSDKSRIENSLYTLTIDPDSGKIVSHIDKHTNIITQLNNQLYHYKGQDRSGAYVFRPKDSSTLITTKLKNIEVYKGELVEEAHIHYLDGYILILRTYNCGDQKPIFEMNYQLGPLADGHELVTRFVSNINNGNVAYGDENGLETIKRYKSDTVQPIAGNYFPMTTRAYIEDSDTLNRLILITDRAHGFGSLNNGELEVMLHRRCVQDDGFGVGEALKENDRVIIKIFGLVGQRKDTTDHMRRLSVLMNHQTHHFYTENKGTAYQGQIQSTMLTEPFPSNIHIATLYVPGTTPVIHLRLHHIYESTDQSIFIDPIIMNLRDIFADIKITDIKELNLLGNELLTKVQDERIQWNGNDGSSTTKKISSLEDTIVTLRPMDIGTYEISFTKK